MVRRNHVASQPTHPTVGAGFHARPALVNRKLGCARKKRCAGCARGIGCAGQYTVVGAPRVTRVPSVTLNVCG